MKEPEITINAEKMLRDNQTMIQVILRYGPNWIAENINFESTTWMMDKISEEIFQKIYPETEKLILSDPQFKERIINDVLIRIANKLSRKLPKKKKKTK